MTASLRHFSTADGVRIAAELRNAAADKPRLALVHSLALDHSFWQPVMDRLAGEAAIVAIDARGHGASGRPAGPYTAERMAQDLREVVEQLGWPDVTVAGASMGGCVALQFAASHPDRTRALGLVDTTAWYGADAPQNWAQRADTARREGLGALVGFQKTRWFSERFAAAEPELVERFVQLFLRNDIEAFSATCSMLGAFDGRGLLAGIRVPTAVVVGAEDYATPLPMAQALHQGIAGSTLTVLPEVRHLTPLEVPEAVAASLRGLLATAA